ncbi:MAG: NmrA family NAD(P)-binding protein [Gluconacetobacter diazotrophicus]|nr:NmrA family NAD(P)-binding protein [Gluconacetobacter diazotrophicus]
MTPDPTIPGTPARTVLVLGATGQQGGGAARALVAAGWRVRALVRDPASSRAIALAAAGVALHRGNLSDPASVSAALLGADAVFSVQPSSGQGAAYGVSDADEIRWGTAVADAALAAGVSHLVYSSVNAAGPEPTGMGHFDSKSAIEAHLRALPLRHTILRPSAFMEILLLPGLGLDRGELTFALRPDQPMQFIAADDIGRIAATALSDPDRFAGRTIEIAGDAVTGDQLAAHLSRAAGRLIACRRFPDEVLAGNPFLASLCALVDDGRLAGRADLSVLRRDFPFLLTLDRWLAGPGQPLLAAALSAPAAAVALR